MKKTILLSVTVGLSLTGMVSCGSNKSQNENMPLPDDTAQQVESVYTPAIDSAVTEPVAAEPTVAPDTLGLTAAAATTEETKKPTSNNGKFDIKVTPGKLKTKHYEGAEAFDAVMTLTVTNQSDSPVSGKDYYIAYKCKEDDGTSESSQTYTSNLKANGIDLGPGASGHITIKRQSAYKFYDFKVKRK